MYDEYPQDYEKLKLALTQEEFEKAEMILLMILQKNPNLPEAKLHLEKVRGKLGSISNYEFRVKAFLDQKDYANAELIIKEASEKFEVNKKIKSLIDYYNKRVEKIAAHLTSDKKSDKPKAVEELDEELPGLESIDIPYGNKPKKSESPWAAKEVNPVEDSTTLAERSLKVEMGLLPEDDASASQREIKGLLRPSSDVIPSPSHEKPSETIRKLREGTHREGTDQRPITKIKSRHDYGSAKYYRDLKKKDDSAYKATFSGRKVNLKESPFDSPAVGKGLIALVAALVLLPMIAAFMFLYQAASVNIDVPSVTMPRWEDPALDSLQYSMHRAKFERLMHGTISGDELDRFVKSIVKLKDMPMQVLETFYSIFKNNENKLTTKQIESVETWRNVNRLAHGLKTPISSDQLNTKTWNPNEYQYDVDILETETLKISLYGVLAGLLPGLILGLALARAKIPFINRIFEVFWEYWFAIPSIAILFICAWVFRESYASSKTVYGFLSILMGMLIAPHIAFYVQQGFENISKKSIVTEIFLGLLVIISAVAIGVARLIGEAVLTLGLLSAVEGNTAFAQSVASFAAPIFNSLVDILPGSFLIFGDDFVPGNEVMLNQSVSMILAYKVLLYSLVITFLAQGLQIFVAYLGLKHDKASEKTSLTNFKMFSKSNVVFAFLGIVLVILMIVFFVNGQGDIDQTRTEKWSQDVNKDSMSEAINDTFIVSVLAGGIALFVGLLPVLFVSMFIRDRFHKASIEALLRIPLGISPLIVIVVAIEILNRMSEVPTRVNTIIIAVIILAPVAWSVLFRTFDRFNGAPYVKPNEVFTTSKKLFVFLARVLSFISIAFFLMAMSMGLLELFVGFKTDYSLVYQLFIMIRDNYQNPATVKVFQAFMSMMLNFIGASLLFKILSEISAQVARVKRLST